jgi:anhydro-N-acetylmuramic acid kinase
VKQHASQESGKVLLTGGGAFNSFLVEQISAYLGPSFEVVVPDPELVNFKEALIFAFLGVLRWRQEPNCLRSVTGARHDNCGGAIYWM